MTNECIVYAGYKWGLVIAPILFGIAAFWFFVQAHNCWTKKDKIGLINLSIMGFVCLYAAFVLVSCGSASLAFNH